MSDDKSAGVDPRFDPAFQRGFDQSIPIEEYVAAPAPGEATEVAQPAPSAQPAAAAEAVIEVEPETLAVAPVPVADLLPESTAGRNPFLLFLGIISLALIVAGVWLFVRSGDAFNSKEVRSQGDYMSLDAAIHMAPFISLLGGATAIGVLFVFAVRWRRRR